MRVASHEKQLDIRQAEISEQVMSGHHPYTSLYALQQTDHSSLEVEVVQVEIHTRYSCNQNSEGIAFIQRDLFAAAMSYISLAKTCQSQGTVLTKHVHRDIRKSRYTLSLFIRFDNEGTADSFRIMLKLSNLLTPDKLFY
jgi:hypothetical protein